MGGQIITAIAAFNAPVNPAGTDNQAPNVIFNGASISANSHYVDVNETAILVRQFGLQTGHTISVHMSGNDGIQDVTSQLVINGKSVVLSPDNTALVIDMPGRYIFRLDNGGDVGVVSCTWIGTGMSYWSWGLKDFALAT